MTPVRRRLIYAGAGLALVALALYTAEMSGWPFLRTPLQDAMTRAAGVPVRLDPPFRLRLLGPPRLQLGHLVVAPGDGLPVPHLVDAHDVHLAWRWSDVRAWRAGGPLHLRSLQARSLDAHLMRTADGRTSWHLGAAPPGGPRETGDRPLPAVDHLEVQSGRIGIDDAPLRTRLEIAVAGSEGDTRTAGRASGYQARVIGHYRDLPLRLQVRSAAVLPLVQGQRDGAEATVPVQVDGRVGVASLHFDGEAGALMGERRLMGHVRFGGPSLAPVGAPLGLTLPHTPPFDLRGDIQHANGIWRLQAERMAIGRSLLMGDFRYDPRPKPGRLTGQLAGPRLALADLAPAIGKTAGEAPARTGRVLPQRQFDLPSLRAMDADLQVAIDELDLGRRAFAPLQELRTHLLLRQGVLTLDELRVGVAGGRFTGATRLDGTERPARWSANLAFDGIDMAGWLRGARTPQARAEQGPAPRKPDPRTLQRQREQARQGGGQPAKSYLTGLLAGRLEARGSGSSTAEILGGLDGHARLWLRDGSLSHLATELIGLDVAQALGVWVGGDKPLPLRCAVVDLQIRDGVAGLSHAVLDNADSTLQFAGQVNLRQETLNLRAVARPKDFSPLALRAPIVVTGTLSEPRVGVESKRLVGRLLGALALGAVAGPVAAVAPLVDPGGDGSRDPCATSPAAGPATKGAAPSTAASGAAGRR